MKNFGNPEIWKFGNKKPIAPGCVRFDFGVSEYKFPNSQIRRFTDSPKSSRSGMTLVEVILALVILAMCLFGLMTGLTNCLEIFRASQFIHEAETAFNTGEALYPLVVESDPISDLEVPPDEIIKGWTYERSVGESGNEDDLFIMTTIVRKGKGGAGKEQEYTRLIFYRQ